MRPRFTDESTNSASQTPLRLRFPPGEVGSSDTSPSGHGAAAWALNTEARGQEMRYPYSPHSQNHFIWWRGVGNLVISWYFQLLKRLCALSWWEKSHYYPCSEGEIKVLGTKSYCGRAVTVQKTRVLKPTWHANIWTVPFFPFSVSLLAHIDHSWAMELSRK